MDRLLFFARPYTRRFLWGAVLLLLTNATSLAMPQLVRMAIDGLHEGTSMDFLRDIAVMMVALAVAGAIFRTLSRVHVFYAARDVEMDLRCTYFRTLTRLAPSFMAKQNTGDLMSRATSDLPQIRLMLGPGYLNLVNTVVVFLLAIPAMASISGKLTAISLSLYPLGVLTMRYVGRHLFLRNNKQQKVLGQLSSFIQEGLGGSHVIRAFAAEEDQMRAFRDLNERYAAAGIDVAWARSGIFRIMATLANISIIFVVFFGAHQVLDEHLTYGELVAMVEYLALIAAPTSALGWVLSMWQRSVSAMARMDEILLAPIEEGVSGAIDAQAPHIEIRDLTLAFGEREVLQHVNIHVNVGKTLGIVGPIGSGKTTLVRCLMRMTDVPVGHVFLCGRDVAVCDPRATRLMFGYVPQNPGLFSDTLRENVRFGKPKADDTAVVSMLQSAAMLRDLEVLPHGLDTEVGERGLTLSGGQKQRTAIARALLVDPPILILDDALSAVDTETEAEILGKIRSLRRGRTTVIVSHRLSAVQHADEIIVLEEGRVVQRGTDASLRAMEGLYAVLAEHQDVTREGTEVHV